MAAHLAADGGQEGFARIRLNLDPESVDLYDYLDMDWFTVPGERRATSTGPTSTSPAPTGTCSPSPSPSSTAPWCRPAAVAGEHEFLGIAGADIRMSHLEPELLAMLRPVPAPAVLVTAERRVVAANTPRWISGTRLDRLPAPGDGTFDAVTEVGADSGWLLAAAALG